MPYSLFHEVVILLTAAVAAAVIAVRLRQPLIIAFIVVGIFLGPVGLNVIQSSEQIRVLAEMGLALLLFVVGLKLDPGLIRNMGPVSLITGLGQIGFTGLVGFGISLLLDMPLLTAMYVSAAIVFSSTIVIVKLLSDKRDTDSLYGRISLGFLIVEDIVVIFAMIALSAFADKSSVHPTVQILLIVAKGTGLLLGIWAVRRVLFPRLLSAISSSTESLVLFGITWALLLAAVSEMMGFSKEVGAFAAGLSLASTLYRDLLSTKLSSLRDFLLFFFFLELGSHLELQSVGSQIGLAIVFSLLVLVCKPFIVMVILGRMGYRKRTGFLAGLTVAQVSEFSLILMAMGTTAGHITNDALALITLVLMITMGASVHLITNSQSLYMRASPYLHIFERKDLCREDQAKAILSKSGSNSVILIGLGRYGSKIAAELTSRGRTVMGVDFDPQAVTSWMADGGQAIFGDAEDPDFAHVLPLASTRWVVSSIRDASLNAGIIKNLRHEGYAGYYACAVEDPDDQMHDALQQQSDLLLKPFEDSAVRAADLIFSLEEQIARKAMDRAIESMHDHYIICGYGRMGQQAARDFQQRGIPFVVIESNPEQLPKLKERSIPHVEGSACESRVLQSAGIVRAKGLIAVNATDEQNVFIVLTARGLSSDLFIVARSILQENEDKLRRAGANKVVSPYILGGHRMAEAVLRPRAIEFLDLITQYDHRETDLGVIQASEKSTFVGSTIRNSGIRESIGVLILAIRRANGEKISNPSPDTVIEAGDEIIVMGTLDQVEAAERLLSGA